EYEKHMDEYTNWVGTGIRFEMLRGDLAKFNSHEDEDQKHFKDALGEAKGLIERMVTLQPNRLYGISPWIRERVGKHLSDAERGTLKVDLENLSMVES